LKETQGKNREKERRKTGMEIGIEPGRDMLPVGKG
jgi:hypothetical protein